MKFNFKATTAVRNYEGARAFEMRPEMELYAAVATAGLNDQFYEATDEKLIRIRELIARTDDGFVARLAIYAREQMYLRSIPLVLVVEMAKTHKGDGLVGRATARVIQRADEIAELLSYYAIANDRKETKQLSKLSKQLQKGLAEAFNKFDEYQFAKYDRDARVTLKDALFIVHPRAKDEAQQITFDRIAKNALKTPYTWETELSTVGQQGFETPGMKQSAIRAKWEELIFSGKMGYMATLRNLHNIMEADVSKEALEKVCAYLGNTAAVAKSKQLPFRFLSAYRELKELKNGRVSKLLDALEEAVWYSAANITGFKDDTKVVIAADVSGSMQKSISAKSKVQNFDIGLMLAMLLQSRCESVMTGMFGDSWKVINVPRQNILANVLEFHRREGEVGYSTNGYLVIQDLLRRNVLADKVMLFTDCQLWNSNNNGETISGLWKQYKKVARGAKLYLFDLAGYGTTPVNVMNDDVYLIAGWSDRLFGVLHALESGVDAIDMIRQISL